MGCGKPGETPRSRGGSGTCWARAAGRPAATGRGRRVPRPVGGQRAHPASVRRQGHRWLWAETGSPRATRTGGDKGRNPTRGRTAGWPLASPGLKGPWRHVPVPWGVPGTTLGPAGRQNSSSKPLTHRSHTQRRHSRPGRLSRAADTRGDPTPGCSDAKLLAGQLRPPTAGASAPAAASAFSASPELRAEGSAPRDRAAPRESAPPGRGPPRRSSQARLEVCLCECACVRACAHSCVPGGNLMVMAGSIA